MANGDFWTTAQWQMFNGNPSATPPTAGLLKTTMGPMEVAQQVFPTVITGNDNPIPADKIDPATGVPSTGATAAFATLQYPFQLAPVQVNDPALTIATNQVALAAQGLALTEDDLFFNGQNATLRPRVTVSPSDLLKLGGGLMGVALTNPILALAGKVPPDRLEVARLPARAAPVRWGVNTYYMVLEGLRLFWANAQGPPYALMLEPEVFADVNLYLPGAPSGVTTASIIQPLLASGPLVQSAGLQPQQGLLASLGGQTTTLYVGTGPLVEFNTYANSVYAFTARESIQFVNVDPRSLIMLAFQ